MPLADVLSSLRWTNVTRNIAWRLTDAETKTPTIQILGAPRSGTTLLKNLIGSHSRIATCQSECTGIFMLRDLFAPNHMLAKELSTSVVAELQADCKNIVEYYERVASFFLKAESKFFLDKANVLGEYNLRYYLKSLVNSRYVFIVRDPRDVASSAGRHIYLKKTPLQRIVDAWLYNIKVLDRLSGRRPTLVVRYEDLCRSPEETMTTVMEFCDLEFEADQTASGYKRSGGRLVNTEGFQRLVQSVDSASIGVFRKSLNEEQIKSVEKLTREGLLRFQYQVEL